MSNVNVVPAGDAARGSSELIDGSASSGVASSGVVSSDVLGPRVIVALDYSDAQQAKALLAQLDPALCRVKVGKQLFTVAGPALIADIQALGFDVFLDLKFHDIPNTVAGACKAAADLGVWMLNVHASGGRRMLEAARAAVPVGAARLIAVTVLTSTTAEELSETGLTRSLEEQVDFLAGLTRECGLDGVVCSPLESARLRKLCGTEFQLVTPGVRPAGAAHSDQRRVMTPADAQSAGSDFLVIGRPITGATDPLVALQEINQSLENGAAGS